MKHTLACAAIIFSAGCIATNGDEPESPDESASAITSPRIPYPGPLPPDETTWTSNGTTVYDFDSYSEYGANLVDSAALSVRVPYVEAGDRLRIEATGTAYAEHPETDVNCILKVHVTDGLRAEAPIETGGGVTFALDDDVLQSHVSATGEHVATAAGITRLRILGRVSRPDRFCGLTGVITIRATNNR